ncbi:MAG TPA: AI-2E family transporter, partial [Candidatus Limnocylindrales bacterium]
MDELQAPAAPTPVERVRDRGPFLGLLIGAAVIAWIARDILGPFILAAVLAYAFGPLVSVAQRRTGWPRFAVVAVAYVFVIAILVLVAYFLAGRIAHEISLLAASGPDSLATLLRQIVGSDTITVGGQQLAV